MKKIISISFFIIALIFFIISISKITSAAGLVPCGGRGETPCTLCHLIIGIHGIVDWLVKISLTGALAGITISGVMYVISSGSPDLMKRAKSFINASLIGFTVTLAAWLIVYTTMWLISAKSDLGIQKDWTKFSCEAQSNKPSNPPTANPSPISPPSIVAPPPVPCKGPSPGLGGVCRPSSAGCFVNENKSDKKSDCSDADVCCIPPPKCTLLIGNKNADFVFMLMRSQFGSPLEGMQKNECENAKDWEESNQNDFNEFKSIASEMANGLKLVGSNNQRYFAVYRMDEIYDGTNDEKISEIIEKDCPEASRNKLFSHGYVYNGGGENAYAIVPENAYYCIKGDKYNDRSFAHEQIGHIFAKFVDEYEVKKCVNRPWANVTEDKSCSKWKKIVSPISCYSNCQCGNCYRSTSNSIMRHHWEKDGVFQPLQNYIIDQCVKNFADCPPANLID